MMEKCLLKKPTKISFKGTENNGNVSHRRRSNVQEDNVYIEDLKLGE